jgi:hypothetical protein
LSRVVRPQMAKVALSPRINSRTKSIGKFCRDVGTKDFDGKGRASISPTIETVMGLVGSLSGISVARAGIMARSGACVGESEPTFSGFGRVLRKVRLEEIGSLGLPSAIGGLFCGTGTRLYIRGDELRPSLVPLHGMTLVFEWRDNGLFDLMFSEVSQLFD